MERARKLEEERNQRDASYGEDDACPEPEPVAVAPKISEFKELDQYLVEMNDSFRLRFGGDAKIALQARKLKVTLGSNYIKENKAMIYTFKDILHTLKHWQHVFKVSGDNDYKKFFYVSQPL